MKLLELNMNINDNTPEPFNPDPAAGSGQAAWRAMAAEMSRNADFYKGIVTQVGDLFGVAARTSDDGSIQGGVLALKVPELVAAALKSGADKELINAVGKYAVQKGEDWRVGEGSEIMDAYEACTTQQPEPAVPALICSVCKMPQFNTPGGLCCKNGHGGADSL